MSAPFIPIDGHNHLFQKSAQKLFAIPIRGGWRSPDFVQIGTERENFLFLFFAQHARALSFPPFEFGLCSGEIAQAPFPLGFESACHQSVLGIKCSQKHLIPNVTLIEMWRPSVAIAKYRYASYPDATLRLPYSDRKNVIRPASWAHFLFRLVSLSSQRASASAFISRSVSA